MKTQTSTATSLSLSSRTCQVGIIMAPTPGGCWEGTWTPVQGPLPTGSPRQASALVSCHPRVPWGCGPPFHHEGTSKALCQRMRGLVKSGKYMGYQPQLSSAPIGNPLLGG